VIGTRKQVARLRVVAHIAVLWGALMHLIMVYCYNTGVDKDVIYLLVDEAWVVFTHAFAYWLHTAASSVRNACGLPPTKTLGYFLIGLGIIEHIVVLVLCIGQAAGARYVTATATVSSVSFFRLP
jgi:hypothetical protein